jgi:nitroreductase/chorismate mutase
MPSPALLALRDRIDTVDAELVPLLAMRLALVASAAEHKPDSRSVSDPERVEEVLAHVRSRAAECGAEARAVEAVYRTLIEEGIELEAAAHRELTARGEDAAGAPAASRAAQVEAAGAADASVAALVASGDGDLAAPNGAHAGVTRDARIGAGGLADPAGAPDSSGCLSTNGTASVASGHLLSVMATMRAMRRLDARPVAPELLDKLVRAASWAPIGGNRQDYRFVIVTDRSRLRRLAPSWSKAMELYLATLRPTLSAEEAQRFERVRKAMTHQCEHFASIPALIVVCREPVSFWKRAVRRPRSMLRHLWTLPPADRLRVLRNLRVWAQRAGAASVYPAVQNLLLAARAYGLGATLTTWHSAFEQEFKAVLEIPRAVHIYAIVPVGYPLGRFGPVRRRPVEQLIGRERWRG